MAPAITGIDHAIVGVRALEEARAGYERLGFTLSPRGSHIGWGTANYCIMFERDYIELLGIVDASQFTNNLDKFLASREGLMGVAFASSDADRAAQELRARGIAAEGPTALERRLELAEGTVLPRFRLVRFPETAAPGLSAFVCQHLTPELVRRPPWLVHANGATRIVSLSVVVERPAALTDTYERLFGQGAVTPTDRLITLRVGRHSILFLDADELTVLHPKARPFESVKPPYLAAMTLGVASPERTAALLTERGVPFEREVDGAVAVAPEASCGFWLIFAEG
ncbi:MAG TPA: VOC family protein [Alphaproteobacteria bacterium]|nr:VOC family protein [Alphaproteobacteria bacterium]